MSTYVTRCGNPSLLHAKTHAQPGLAKNRLRKQVAELRTWAAKFNLDLMAECDRVAIELSDLNLTVIPIGHTRRWELTDQPSGVTLVVEVEKNG